jgi:transposase
MVPIQNNQAERDLRKFVIMRKISGETKSQKGDRSIKRHLSIIQTARKQGLPVFTTLHGLLTRTLPVSVLTGSLI